MRRCTYDAGMMREKLRRVRTRSLQKALEGDDVFKQPSPIAGSPITSEADKDKRENEALKLELKNMKEKYIQLTKVPMKMFEAKPGLIIIKIKRVSWFKIFIEITSFRLSVYSLQRVDYNEYNDIQKWFTVSSAYIED